MIVAWPVVNLYWFSDIAGILWFVVASTVAFVFIGIKGTKGSLSFVFLLRIFLREVLQLAESRYHRSRFNFVDRSGIFGLSRQDIVNAYSTSDNFSKASRFSECGKTHRAFVCANCGKPHKYDFRCKLSLCPECGEKRVRYILMQVDKSEYFDHLFNDSKIHLRFVTLTFKNIDSLYRGFYKDGFIAFRKLRRILTDKGLMLGGIYAFETKNIGNGWNHHIHYCYDGEFLNKTKLKNLWKELTGSYIVDIEKVKTGAGAFREVLKYVLKPMNLTGSEFAHGLDRRIAINNYIQYLTLTSGIRMFNTWGSFRREIKVGSPKGSFLCDYCGYNALKTLGPITLDVYNSLLKSWNDEKAEFGLNPYLEKL